jgi:hypothetical protein
LARKDRTVSRSASCSGLNVKSTAGKIADTRVGEPGGPVGGRVNCVCPAVKRSFGARLVVGCHLSGRGVVGVDLAGSALAEDGLGALSVNSVLDKA